MIGKKQIEELIQRKIGYLPIENFSTPKKKVCETPRHENQNIEAFAVMALIAPEYDEPVVQMICRECWKYFDDHMNHPQWNILEWK
ncbi:MAG TPA: hypothetical protein VH815_10360 [Acidobacteriota bacterium]|jgi:hypothetical protein